MRVSSDFTEKPNQTCLFDEKLSFLFKVHFAPLYNWSGIEYDTTLDSSYEDFLEESYEWDGDGILVTHEMPSQQPVW